MDDLVRRAIAAYMKSPGEVAQPNERSAAKTLAGHKYVVLRGAEGVLAIYRVKNDGFLRRMRRPPKKLLT